MFYERVAKGRLDVARIVGRRIGDLPQRVATLPGINGSRGERVQQRALELNP